MKYTDQIKSPKWQKKRLEILNQHEYKCEICGATEKTLHVHHARYIKGRKIWEYDNDVLMCLCEDCHAKEHKKDSDIPDEVIELGKFLVTNLPEYIISELKELSFLNLIRMIIEYKRDEYEDFVLDLEEYISDYDNFCELRKKINDYIVLESLKINISILKSKICK